MRQVTNQITNAFKHGKVLKVSNSYTDGNALFLFGNKIAEYRKGELWITNAGWSSATTKERLNALPGVSISQAKGVWYLNGKEWDGKWTMVGIEEDRKEDSPFKAMAMVMKMGELLAGNTKKEKNDWKLRMAKAGMGEGINVPEDWDTLSEDEKERRLNGIIDMNLKK